MHVCFRLSHRKKARWRIFFAFVYEINTGPHSTEFASQADQRFGCSYMSNATSALKPQRISIQFWITATKKVISFGPRNRPPPVADGSEDFVAYVHTHTLTLTQTLLALKFQDIIYVFNWKHKRNRFWCYLSGLRLGFGLMHVCWTQSSSWQAWDARTGMREFFRGFRASGTVWDSLLGWHWGP